MNEKLRKCACGGSLLVSSRLPVGFMYLCSCSRRWIRDGDGWAEVASLTLRDGRVWICGSDRP